MRFKVKASDLWEAFEGVSIVAPRPVNNAGGAGFLFVIRGERCYIYARDQQRVARTDFAITDVEGEGAFVYPAAHTKGFQYLGDRILAFEATSDGENHTVKFEGDDISSQHVSLDPRLLQGCDRDLEAATNERSFSVPLLREALSLPKPFLADLKNNRAEEHHKTIQLFDKSNPAWEKGDGWIFASNSIQAFWFYTASFEGKGLAVHGDHLGVIGAFLAKSTGEVTVKTGANMTFITNSKGQVFGWTHHTKTYTRYTYMSHRHDTVVLKVPVFTVMNALNFTLSELAKEHDKVRVVFTAASNQLSFQAANSAVKLKSFPVIVDPQVVEGKEGVPFKDWAYNVNINHFMDLFRGVKGNEVSLRVAIQEADEKKPKETAIFRTVDEFHVDKDGKVLMGAPEGSTLCSATRYLASKD